ncbi:tyrosine-type recombinase/integrase [Pseudofrankia sp. BMG5.37]|nr:tyrosine-type recombinase/integrase [Pseudofrankia sp. BMG5.37]MDT3445156.1 tyrosine-type recombinase/integrase [Pseudofrankia sp. BMG5.37]
MRPASVAGRRRRGTRLLPAARPASEHQPGGVPDGAGALRPDRAGHRGLDGAPRLPAAGIDEIGPHRLRHTVACEMVLAGVPLVATAQVLRHRSLQTTALYARADVGQLRALALAWPGAEADR